MFKDTNIPPPPTTRRLVGLDLGKHSDPSALTVLDWTWPRPSAPFPAMPKLPTRRPTYNVTALRRWPLGTPYVDIVGWLTRLFLSPALQVEAQPMPVLVVDETGVGVAVVEMLHEAMIHAKVNAGLIKVTNTAGAEVSFVPGSRGRWRVAKRALASVLVTLFSSRRLNIVEMPERALLIREAQNFTTKITEAGNETFESWRDSEHDDLVLSLALACWAAEWIDWQEVNPWPPRRPVAGLLVS